MSGIVKVISVPTNALLARILGGMSGEEAIETLAGYALIGGFALIGSALPVVL